MKKFIVLILVFIASQNIFAQSGWVIQNPGLTNNSLYDVSFFGSEKGWVVDKNANLFVTSNGGTNWNFISNSYPYTAGTFPQALTAFGENAILLTTAELRPFLPPSSLILKSGNSGLSWYLVYRSDVHSIIRIYFLNSLEGWAVEFGGGTVSHTVIKTTNGGSSWNSVYSSSPFTNGTSAPYFINSLTGWYLNLEIPSNLYKTTDGGSSWTSTVLSSVYGSLHFFNETTGFICGTGLAKTTNGGLNWITKLSDLDLNKVIFINDQTGWTFGASGKIWKTTNQGENWTMSVSFNKQLISGVFVNQNTGWIVGSEGLILKTINGGVGITQTSSTIPDKFSLNQNYPNPFNPSTRINYELRNSNYVSLKVFDLLGKEVAQLVNEKQNAGSYAVDFNSAELNLPSGIYFYTLNAGEFKETRKMVLVK